MKRWKFLHGSDDISLQPSYLKTYILLSNGGVLHLMAFHLPRVDGRVPATYGSLSGMDLQQKSFHELGCT